MKSIIAILTGIICGSIVNMGFVMLGGTLFPPPAGIDTSSMEGLLEAMPLMEPKHFLMPFIAHAAGTFVGAWLAARIAPTKKLAHAMVIGGLFLIGGIYMVYVLPSPLWFTLADIGLAYIPMAYLGYKIASRRQTKL